MDLKFQEFFKEQGYTQQTIIQQTVYQPLKAGESILGLAPTGSGKTLAYTLPLLENVVPAQGVQLMIVAPSQELAAQLATVIRRWAALKELKVTTLIGGANVKRQLEKLKKKPEVIVGTPGRMLELADAKKLKLHHLHAVVFDEADELLTDETLTACRALLAHAPGRQVQLSFFSATTADIFQQLEHWFGVPIKTYDVRAQDQTQGEVTHYLLETPTRKRTEALRRLAHLEGFSALVFFKQVAVLEEVAAKLDYQKVPVATLEGQSRQQERQRSLEQLRQGKIKLLLTTDVAARGLDIQQLPAVVNYDLTADITIYIHRVGRTGRMGAQGAVINLGNEHVLRTFRQLLRAGGYEPVQGELFGGKLLKANEVAAKSELKSPLDRTSKNVKPRTSKPVKMDNSVSLKKKHKGHKKRKRDQLNKGKRRVSKKIQ
ncbi:DEAD/DEAH box helicase [Liquorilactobacillus satsumensis]|uniref:DEAD/DEAH box helicase n=1 Tax=Liquorilactobacillus satsumensis TaxID=259059 RepID=UPI0021C2A523|nr:DEAD/DEAH box helicase [Liquorilactobacillus satsumensis]MCP9313206.1 DEAD/DEAH box helicase [Liquorilactobacillus satsumensis]MCP9360311.1 DEAD/DEAH box helicase [Liquorilactobacillus satsumensis]